jgi:hypothetical protein
MLTRKELTAMKHKLERGTLRMAEIVNPEELVWLIEQAEKEVFELCLCESQQLFLREHRLYRFTAEPSCKSCQKIKAIYHEEEK